MHPMHPAVLIRTTFLGVLNQVALDAKTETQTGCIAKPFKHIGLGQHVKQLV